MSEPQESQPGTDRTEPIVAPPTANPSRVRVPPEGPGAVIDDAESGESGPMPAEEA